MIQRLWFDLRATLLQAEHALSGTSFDRSFPEGVDAPALVLHTGVRPWLAGNGLPALRATPVVAAAHLDLIDGTTRNAGGQRVLPLTVPAAPARVPLRDLLRQAAAERDHWVTVEVAADSRLTVATFPSRDTVRAPDGARWVDAMLTAGRLGPYPGQVAVGYRHAGALIARLRTDTLHRLAADLRDEDLDNRPKLTVGVADGEARLIDPAGTRIHLTPDPDGWWHISHPALAWAATAVPDDGQAQSVFESCGPHGEHLRCTVCGAVDEVVQHQVPSMAGYGFDTSIRCTLCGSYETTDPVFGWRPKPAVWPLPPEQYEL